MAKDIFHDAVREALEKDGWTVTHDPYSVYHKEQQIDYDIDLGAEKLLAAEKGLERIAIEVKIFAKPSLPYEFHSVLGQYLVYVSILRRFDSNRILYLAIPLYADERIESFPFILEVMKEYQVNILVFDSKTKTIVSWKR